MILAIAFIPRFIFIHQVSNQLSAPVFGAHNSKIAIEAILKESSQQNSFLVKQFNQVPKEIPINVGPVPTSLQQGARDLRSELAQSAITDHQPSTTNAAHQFETPRRNLQRQAYVAMKASPNVSADGDAHVRVCE